MGLSQKIAKSELGKARCLSCGEKWGSHMGIDCSHRRSSTFHPEGFSLSDICKNCGSTLKDHEDRAECKHIKDSIFERGRFEDFFSDGEFEI